MDNSSTWQHSVTSERIKLSLILIASLVASYGLYLLSVDEVTTGALWILAAVVLWIIGFFRADWLSDSALSADVISKRLGWILFAAVVIVGVFFRLYQLTDIPWGMSIDGSANALKALDILRGAPYEPLHLSRETMYMYFMAGSMKIFGLNSLAVRATSAFWGILALIPCYFFARKLFNTPIALISTLILATSVYHITYSRSEWRCVQVPVFELGAFYFLYQALHKKRWWYWALTGLMIGLGLNTYDSFRFVPIAIGLFLLLQALRKKFLAQNWRGLLILVVFSAIFFGPLGILAITHWPEFAARASATSIEDKVQKAQSLQPLWDNIANTFLAPIYHAQGDFFDNQKPLFSPLESLLYLGGISFLLANLRSRWAGFILLTYLVTLIPAVVTSPNSQRLIAAIPLTYVMAGLFLYALLQQFHRAGLAWHWVPALPVYGLAALFCIAWAYTIYLGPERRLPFGYEPERLVVAQYAKSISATDDIIIDDRFNQGQVDFANYIPGSDPYTHRFETFEMDRDIPVRRQIDRDLTIILEDLPHNRDLLTPLKQVYPDLTMDDIPDHYNPTQTIAFAIHIPKQSLQSAHGYRLAYYSSPTPEAANLLSEKSASALLPGQIPVGAKSATLETWLWIDQLRQYAYQVPHDALAFEVDGRRVDIQNDRAAPILSQGFHHLQLTVNANLSSMNLLDGDGRPIPLGSSFDLQSPPVAWLQGLSTQIADRTWQPIWRVGGNGIDANHFARPMNLVVDAQGMIYVGDADNRRIVKLDSTGKSVTTWGGWGVQPGYLEHEIGLTLLNDQLIVSDRWNDRIQVWDNSGHFEGVLVAPDQIGSPRAVAALPNNTFLVAAAGEAGIHQFSGDGQLLQEWGEHGTCPGCFIEPVGVAYDPAGYVYVTDAGKHTVQKFNPEGMFINEWYVSGITWESYVAVGPDHLVYITAPDENTIYTLTPQGNFLVYPTATGDWQYFPGNFTHPMGITLDGQGALYATNAWSDEVAKYVPAPGSESSSFPLTIPPAAPGLSLPGLALTPTLIYTGTTESKPATFFLGPVTVNNGQLTLTVTQIPGHAAVYDAIWLVDTAGKIYRFEAEDPQITRGDTFSPNYGLDNHWWLQPYSGFSNGYGLLAEKEETAPVLTTTVQLPNGDYRLYLDTFTGDPASGPFMIGVDITTEQK